MSTASKSKTKTTCEIAYVLLGDTADGAWHARMMWRRSGRPASVEFDWQKVMIREEKKGDVVGFFHTHPQGFSQPSARDDKTMFAWSVCFGKPLLCLIDAGEGIRGWVYDYKTEKKFPVHLIRKFRNNWLVVIE